jgi:hypothetical protein
MHRREMRGKINVDQCYSHGMLEVEFCDRSNDQKRFFRNTYMSLSKEDKDVKFGFSSYIEYERSFDSTCKFSELIMYLADYWGLINYSCPGSPEDIEILSWLHLNQHTARSIGRGESRVVLTRSVCWSEATRIGIRAPSEEHSS